MKISLPKFNFKFKKTETVEQNLPIITDVEKKKSNVNKKRFLLYIPVVALGFIVGYVYMSDSAKTFDKPVKQNTTQVANISNNPFEDNNKSNIPANTGQQTEQLNQVNNIPKEQNQQINTVTVEQNTNKNQSVGINTTSQSAPQQNQQVATNTFSNKLYIPAKDILSNSSYMKQELENQIAYLKAQVELKKLETELKKAEEDQKLIPLMTKAQQNKIASEILEKRVEPVKVPIIVPDLVGVYNTNGQKIGVFSLQGYQIRATEGGRVGEFEIKSISNNQAVLNGPDGKQYVTYIKMPDKYPVSGSMFKKSSDTPKVIAPVSTPEMVSPVPSQPAMVQIPQQPIPFPFRQ